MPHDLNLMISLHFEGHVKETKDRNFDIPSAPECTMHQIKRFKLSLAEALMQNLGLWTAL
jgi:hypothetical protein